MTIDECDYRIATRINEQLIVCVIGITPFIIASIGTHSLVTFFVNMLVISDNGMCICQCIGMET
jgi:hypothetical protein